MLDRLRERPTWRHPERLPPLLFLLGPAEVTTHVAKVFGERCDDERTPVSRIDAETDKTDVPGVLREAMVELSHPNCQGRGEPPLRFPLLEMALWLRHLREIRDGDGDASTDDSDGRDDDYWLVQKLIAADPRARRRALAREIRQRGRDLQLDPADAEPSREHARAGKGRLAVLLTHLDQIAPIAVAVVALVSLTAASTLDLAAAVVAAAFGLAVLTLNILGRTRGWFADWRYRWFPKQKIMPVKTPNHFRGFAVEMVVPRKGGGGERRELLDELVVAAFLQDLRLNYRRGLRRAPWARIRYPVLIFDHLPTGHIGCRFIEVVERVRSRSQEASGQPDFDPLVIVAGVDPTSPLSAVEPVDPRAPRLVDRLGGLIAVERADDGPADLTTAVEYWKRYTEEQDRLGSLGSRRELRIDLTTGGKFGNDPARPARRRPRAAHPALPWFAIGTILVLAAGYILPPLIEGCEGGGVRRGGNGECVGVTDGSFHFNGRLTSIEKRIKMLNDRVTDSGKPYVTLVYLGPLTADPATKNPEQDLLASAQGELVGLAMEQQEHNDSSTPPRIRVLLANTGSKMRYAESVAAEIKTKALHDHHIVGVVGFEQSRLQTQQAITEISRMPLPMIGTANSYDHTAQQGTDFSPYYFRLAPPNSRLAAHAAHWARSGKLGIRARTVTVIYDGDPADLYSRNLAEDFRAAFGPGRVSLQPYTDPGQVAGMVQRACLNPPDLFYYAGRSDEFRSFIYQLKNTDCKGTRVVLADDEIAKYVNDNAMEIGDDDAIKLFFTPLALREAWRPEWVGGQPVNRVFDDYKRFVGEVVGSKAPQPSATRAAVSYDATLMFARVAAQIYGDQHVQPTYTSVLAALLDPESGASLQGASGVLRFGSRANGHQVDDKPVLLATVVHGGALRVLAVCGKLVTHDQHAADCPATDRRLPVNGS